MIKGVIEIGPELGFLLPSPMPVVKFEISFGSATAAVRPAFDNAPTPPGYAGIRIRGQIPHDSLHQASQVPSGLKPAVQVLNNGVTRLDVSATPLGLMMVRSGAGSPFKFESMPLKTVAFSPDSKVNVSAMLTPPRNVRAKWLPLFLKNGKSYKLETTKRWR